jgi:hypothetical protein
MRTSRLVSAFVLSLALILCCSGFGDHRPQLWYWHHSYLATDEALVSAEKLIDRACKAGYTGVVFWDSSFSFLSDSFWPPENVNRLRAALGYAAAKGLMVTAAAAPFGFSNDALQANPNWAESQRLLGSRFRVDGTGRKLLLINGFSGLQNAGFELGRSAWFDLNDAGASLDRTTVHSGHASGVIRYASGNARFRQLLKLTPWRQYHVRLYVKTQAFQGLSQLEILDASGLNRFHPVNPLLNATFQAGETGDWHPLDYAFNSREATSAYLYFGVWGGSVGTIWFDDVGVEETALVYVTRRPGTPVKVYDLTDPARVFQEGTDYDPITDPRMTSTRTPFTDSYHPPGEVTLPSSTRLKLNQIVAIDSYSVFPIPGIYDVGMCLTAPGVLDWQRRNASAIKSVLPPGAGLLMGYDEMRQMNSCGSCRAMHMSTGELLAWSTGHSVALYKAVLPGAPLYVWNDMFDPFHNAVKRYYNVEGDLAGSWKGVPAEVSVVNWNLGNLNKSLRWFSGQGFRQPTPHKQIVAGYYDLGDGAAAARTELRQASGVPAVDGLMYTTWKDDYSQLEPFAETVRANWKNYEASVANGPSGSPVRRMLIAACFVLLAATAVMFFRRLRNR